MKDAIESGSPAGLLAGLLVLDMAQFLSGPSAALRLGDLGARVIKIEKPGTGDRGRQIYLSDRSVGGDSTLFHAINRNKESFAADLKSQKGREAVLRLFAKADVVIQNFRPGVAHRLGVDYAAARQVNPRIVYASISGYGESSPWAERPGQDLLAQAYSGVMWLNGNDGDGPVPIGLSVADMLAGHLALEGILAALVRRGICGQGAHVETSLLEAMIDFQFEVLATYLSDTQRPLRRSAVNNAHACLSAPYGVYATSDGYLALAMTPLDALAKLIGLPALKTLAREPGAEFSRRDEAKRMISDHLLKRPTDAWLSVLRAADVWCAPVLNWPQLLATEAFRRLDMLNAVAADERSLTVTSSPLRIDGIRSAPREPAPKVGEHTSEITKEFGLPFVV